MDKIARQKNEVREILLELRRRGVPEVEIQALFKIDEPFVSRLVITKDLKILLPDYGKEIKMEPLHKAVFFVFLRHPEGIRYKEITDYQEELAMIYRSMKLSTQARKKVEKSIVDVTNPLNLSIYEKCARINGIFKNELGALVAKHYQILGEKGEKRAIGLDRELVFWEVEFGKP